MTAWAGADRLAAKGKLDASAEAALVLQCRRQDYDAFGKIVDAYQARITGFVRRMVRDQEEAADITQEVFIKAFQGMSRFDGRASLRTWLFRIAYNLCVDRARRHERAPARQSIDVAPDGEEPVEFADFRWDPERKVLEEELQQVLEQAIAEMSDKLKTVLLLHDKEDMGYEEIAMAIDVPVGTVKSRLFLARSHVQKRVSLYLAGAES
ncbi:MAG: sigma-70 family RNA polymerase sigma factor [Fimbriimonadaceae bacterium]|nr:sigma-70 family RNA polymerase sigma factor [Fimbriimonadaceae bacterium]QYK55418.1 MAG: sigma-70 family RNA polymerase sigma factor [Fimbriimonadaceae bacterium]